MMTVSGIAIFAALCVLVSASTKLCGDVTFDNEEDMCCDNHVTPRPQCGPNQTTKCCQQVGFDSTSSMCCHGAISPRPDGWRQDHKCCGTQAFNKASHMCCHGQVEGRPSTGDTSRHKCCETEAFSQDMARCVRGSVVYHVQDESTEGQADEENAVSEV